MKPPPQHELMTRNSVGEGKRRRGCSWSPSTMWVSLFETRGSLYVFWITITVFLGYLELGQMSMVTGVPALFVFGDSLLDCGNGDYLQAIAKIHLPFNAGHLPYGRDLPSHSPSGRYSNGLVAADVLARFLGLPYPPPYLAKRDDILKGTSFATAGAVVDNSTGSYPFPRLNFYDQVGLFAEVKHQLVSMLGESNTDTLISKSLLLIWLGSNDYFESYNSNPLGKSMAQKKYNPYEYRKLVISSYKGHLESLYDLGARKFAIVSLPAFGCAPVVRLLFRGGKESCVASFNEEAQSFNVDLLAMSKQLQAAYPDGHFTFLDTYDLTLDIIANPSTYGLVEGTKPCCATGPLGGVPVCSLQISSVCEDAAKYVFWDYTHPTEAVDELLTKRFMTASSPDVEPFNIQQLSML